MKRMMILERGVWVVTLALAIMYLLPSIPIIFGAGDFDSDAVRVIYGVGGVSPGVAMLTGLFVGPRAAWLGAGLVVAGAIAMAFLWFWLFYALVPLTLLVTGFAIYRARRTTREGAPAHAA